MKTLLLTTAFAMTAIAAQAEEIRFIVPFAPGGAQDTLARWYAAQLTQRSDYAVIVENQPGGAGSIAANYVSQAAPDGRTLLLATGGAITIAPHLRELPYDPEADFAPVALIADTPMTLAVRADSPFQTLDDVVSAAREDPGALTYGSTGHASVSHLTGALLAQATDTDLLHVPYQGAAPAITDLMGGHIDMMVNSAASIEQQVSSGAARVLVVFSPVQLSNLQDIPTIEEAVGAEDLNSPVWAGFLAPAGTPEERLLDLASNIMEVCELPETQERYLALGATVTCGDASALTATMSEDGQRWGKVISEGNITVD